MSKLDNLLDKFEEVKAQSFNYNKSYSEVMRQISELSFIAEIDKDDYYISMLEQIFVEDDDGNTQLITLDDSQREQFYTKGTIDDYPYGFRIADSLHIYINKKEQYVQIFNSHNIIEKFSDPREDYGKVYTEFNKDGAKRYLYERAEFKINQLPDDDIGKETLTKLIKVFELSKTNTVNVADFDLKTTQNVSMFWGNLKHKDNLIDDEYQETSAPEYIELPHSHKDFNVESDLTLKNILLGNGYDDINYDNGLHDENGEVGKSFNSLVKAESYFYSIIDYINKGKIIPTIHPGRKPQHIDYVEKHYLSNLWPTPPDNATDEDLEKIREENTRYKVYVTKFHDNVIIKLEVWEYGIVYIVTNVYDRRSIN